MSQETVSKLRRLRAWLFLGLLALSSLAAGAPTVPLTITCAPDGLQPGDEAACELTVADQTLTAAAGAAVTLDVAPGRYTVATRLTGPSAGRWLPGSRTDTVSVGAGGARLSVHFSLAGRLDVTLRPTGSRADLYVDGALAASQVTNVSVLVASGAHRVQARAVTGGYDAVWTTHVFSGWTRHLVLDVSAPSDPAALRASASWRFGIGVPEGLSQAAWVTRLGAGWWYDWRTRPNIGGVAGEYWQMIRVTSCSLKTPVRVFTGEARRRPGQTWIIGNEPDSAEQDGVTPECLADLYHDAYTALKAADPSARVALGGLVQASPLRLKYLDRVLARYRSAFGGPLPADLWTMHAYVLREERGSWGAGIPVGLDDASGWLLQPGDHDSLSYFKSQIQALRTWMAANGYRSLPLVITEYGILLPDSLGYTPERVQDYMQRTFDYLLSAADPALGQPADSNRLVQRWAWFSLSYSPLPVSDLLDPGQKQLTPLGRAFRDYIARLP